MPVLISLLLVRGVPWPAGLSGWVVITSEVTQHIQGSTPTLQRDEQTTLAQQYRGLHG